jgi:RND family efflux transporter MFP subunit
MNTQLDNRSKTTTIFAVAPSAHTTANEPRSRYRKLTWLAALAALVAVGGYFRYQNASHSAEPVSNTPTHVRQVNVTMPERAAPSEITLPATVSAHQSTDLFARVNGFLKAWHRDIGGPVKSGQVLAEIETPELDQELAQAVAFLKQGEAEHQQAIAELDEARAEVTLAEANILKAKANLDYAVAQHQRNASLLNNRAIARQEFESSERERDARKAELASANADLSRRKTNLHTRQSVIESRAAIVGNRKANVQRLRDLTSFQKIVAPFDGIVTRRTAEVGMLVTSGSNAGTQPLYSVAQTDLLRVQASVPQSSALGLKAGDAATVTIPEMPGQRFPGRVARTAGAVDPVSRSLLVEIELPNRNGLLPPGVYAQVRFQSAKEQTRWVVQTKALAMRPSGPHVIVVTANGTVRTQAVTLGKDFGSTAEVLAGLNGDEQLVVNPTDDLRDGLPVVIAGRETQAYARK